MHETVRIAPARRPDPAALSDETRQLLGAYAQGIFPMADSTDGSMSWYRPLRRGVIPLDAFHVPRRLAKTVRSGQFEIHVDRAFRQVMYACASEAPGGRPSSWINLQIVEWYTELHEAGFAHSVETWRDGKLAGGLYGVALGGLFAGESMFSRERDASKVALVHLAGRLRHGGYTLLDAQFHTPHLDQFGAVEIPALEYDRRLRAAMEIEARFHP